MVGRSNHETGVVMVEQAERVATSAAIEHLRWALTPGVGPALFARIIEAFGSAQEALGVGVDRMQKVESVGRATAEAIVLGRDRVDVEAEIRLAAEHGVRILCRDDEEFPAPLRYIPDPPICLYVKGQLLREDGLAVAIVGSRKPTIYGQEQAHRFGYQLASHGMTIVSGLARGIDSEGHKGALAAGGRTLAVLGNGLARIYPPENRDLAVRVEQSGALLSELPMNTSPAKENFLPRNRIIAGLSLGTLVVEAARRSGALATARLSSEYDREVFAVPGRVDTPVSEGTNALIRDQHGKLVMSVEDILDELGEAGQMLLDMERPGEPAPQRAPVSLNENEQAICNALDRDGRPIESIAEASGLPANLVASTLISLQLKGVARQMPGNVFVRVGGG